MITMDGSGFPIPNGDLRGLCGEEPKAIMAGPQCDQALA